MNKMKMTSLLREDLRDALSNWSTSLINDHYNYYVTLRTNPVVCREHLEALIKEWSKRINKRILGRNWCKKSNDDRRMKGIVFFESIPDCHAHALIRPPIPSSYELSEDQTVRLLTNYWSPESKSSPRRNSFRKDSVSVFQEMHELRNCINLDGDCLVQILNTREDMRATTRYSTKQTDFYSLSARDDFAFIEDLQSYRTRFSMNKFSDPKFDRFDLFMHVNGFSKKKKKKKAATQTISLDVCKPSMTLQDFHS